MKWGGVKRSVRVGDVMHKEIAGLLLKGLKDPRLDGVSVTGIDVTDDLHEAVLYFQVRGDQERIRQAQKGFQSAEAYLRSRLRQVMYIRVIPRFKFRYDDTLEKAARIEELLKQIHHTSDG